MQVKGDILLETKVLEMFKDCKNVEDIKANVERLIKEYHLDNGSENSQTSEEIEIILKNWKNNPQKVLEELKEDINLKEIRLSSDYEVIVYKNKKKIEDISHLRLYQKLLNKAVKKN